MVPLNRFGVAFAIGRGTGKSSDLLAERLSSISKEASPRSISMHAAQIKRTSLPDRRGLSNARNVRNRTVEEQTAETNVEQLH